MDVLESGVMGSAPDTAWSSRYRKCVVIGCATVDRRDGQAFTKRAVAQYLQELAASFAEVWFVAALNRKPQNYRSLVDPAWASVITWDPSAPLVSVRAAARLCRLADSSTTVLLQMPNVYALPLIPLLRLRAGRLVVYAAGDWVEFAKELQVRGKGWRAPIDTAAVRLALRCSDVALVRGPKLAAQAAPFAKSVLLSQPIIDRSHAWTRRTDTCESHEIRVLYVGKLRRSKGTDVLLDAIGQLLATSPDLASRIRLDIIGAGDEEALMRRRVADLSLEDAVQFRGFIDDGEALAAAYARADILVVPSAESEGLPRVIDEGLRHQLPIVATAVGGIPVAYREGEDLLLVRPSDAADLAGAIRRLIHDRGLRQRLIAAARRRSGEGDPLTAGRQHASVLAGWPAAIIADATTVADATDAF